MRFNFFKKIWGKGKKEEEKKPEKPEEKKIEISVELGQGQSFKIFPLITEKTLRLARENKYTFLVDPKINKTQIRKAIEKMFKVNVEDVKTMNYKERIRGLTKIKSRRPKFKKAVVKITSGQTIPIFG